MKKLFQNEFIRFGIIGVLNTGIYYGVYLIALLLLQIPYVFSHWIGIILSVIASFFLNSYFTYRVKPTWKKFLQFPITQVVNVICSTTFLYVFVNWLQMSSIYAPIFAMFLTVPITFIITGKIMKK